MPIVVAVLVLLADQIVKFVCATVLPTLPGASYSVIEGVFNLTYVENTGAAFGMLSGVPWLLHIITVILVAALIYILVTRYKSMPTLMRFSFCLILSGALGNFIDRIFLGYVRDMFDFCLINFYVFNVADAAITVGTIALVLDILFFKGKTFIKQELQSDAADKPATDEACDICADNSADTDTVDSDIPTQREK